MARIKLGWAMLTVPQKIVKATSIMSTMAENATIYPTPNPTLAEIETAINALKAAQIETVKGGTDRTVTRNARLAELTVLMGRLVDYVQLISQGDPEMISKAGLEVKDSGTPWPIPSQVIDLQAAPGANPGTVVLTWAPVKHKKSYVIELWVEGGVAPPTALRPPSADGAWEIVALQGKRLFTATGLTTGKNYRFRVAAQNSAGIGHCSDEVQSVAR